MFNESIKWTFQAPPYGYSYVVKYEVWTGEKVSKGVFHHRNSTNDIEVDVSTLDKMTPFTKIKFSIKYQIPHYLVHPQERAGQRLDTYFETF